jgi:hypothetical protein
MPVVSTLREGVSFCLLKRIDHAANQDAGNNASRSIGGSRPTIEPLGSGCGNLNSLRFGFFRLRKRQIENAVPVFGADLVRIDGGG